MAILGRLVAVLLLLGLSVRVSSAQTEQRVALVIGNGAYESVAKIPNAINDARLVARTLSNLGFKLVGDGAELNLDKALFDRAVQDFGTQISGAGVALFYYAGHGVQVRGSNYLVPVTANPARETDVDFQMVDVQLVLRQMEAGNTRLNLLILDACRNNPFGGRGLRSAEGGLAQMRAPRGTLISYATQPGNVAFDGPGDHSPYTLALADAMRRPGLGVFEVFNEVGLAVERATRDQQQPWLHSSPLDGSFYFAGPTTVNVQSAEPPAPAAPTRLEKPQPPKPQAITRVENHEPKPEVSVAGAVARGEKAAERGDYAEAMRWYREAADQGDAHAQVLIGDLFLSGSGVAWDAGEGTRWYHKAADQGNAKAEIRIAQVSSDRAEQMRWYRKAADQGDADAQFEIGWRFETGPFYDVAQDYGEAMLWYRKAADQGHARAARGIAELYLQARGVAHDRKAAWNWMQKAAARGESTAKWWIEAGGPE
jgi:hypothetical protein